MDLLKAAQDYSQQGIPIFPLKPSSKLPATKHGFKDASTHELDVSRWWDENPDYNIGMPTGKVSGIFVLDLDSHAARVEAKQRGYIPTDKDGDIATRIVSTSGNKIQVYFRYPPDASFSSSAGTLGKNMDIRGEGGFVLLPPSRHPDGGLYSLVEDHEIADAPQKLIEDIRVSKDVPKTTRGNTEATETIPDGTRNTTLTSRAGKLFKQGHNELEVGALLLAMNQSRCTPPLEDDEVGGIVKSVARYDRGELKLEVQPEHDRDGFITAADLEHREFAPLKWAVPGILPEGVVILAAKPKMGKSWLALGLCAAVASGGVALGTRSVEQGEALYLDLEGNQRRLKDRLKQMGTFPAKLHLKTAWNSVDAGGVEDLDTWLFQHPDCRLVVVDTLKKVRSSKRGGKNAYDVEYEDIEPFTRLAAAHNTTILFVHHYRKDVDVEDPYDAISGSTGLSAAVDGVLLMKRERGEADAFLYVDGRDIEEDNEYAIRWDDQVSNWCIQGDAARFKMSPERREIVELLQDKGAMGPTAIARALDKNNSTVKNTLAKMLEDHQIDTQDGKYFVDHVDRIDSVDRVDSVDHAA